MEFNDENRDPRKNKIVQMFECTAVSVSHMTTKAIDQIFFTLIW